MIADELRIETHHCTVKVEDKSTGREANMDLFLAQGPDKVADAKAELCEYIEDVPSTNYFIMR